MTAWFITATGTELGKTVVTAALAHQLSAHGFRLQALKPVITGFDPADAESDTAVLLRAQGRNCTAAAIAEVSPWRFAAALAPDMAAARENRRLDPGELVVWCNARLDDPAYDLTLIEGLGGAFVPLDDLTLVADWIAALACPNLLITGNYLGGLSHTIATVEAMAARGIAPAAVIVSDSPARPVPLSETVAALNRRLPVPVSGLAHIQGAAPWRRAPDLSGLLGKL